MKNEKLNKGIAKICDDQRFVIHSSRKCIPYIGWFWRNVDFDQSSYCFGVSPGVNGFTGFMENNKWDYPYTRETTKKEWRMIRNTLESIVNNPDIEVCQALWLMIQEIEVEI